MQDEVRAAGGANELEPDVPAGDTERALRKRTGLESSPVSLRLQPEFEGRGERAAVGWLLVSGQAT